MRETEAIPAVTSLLTSEPISATEVLRENSLSFHPLVLFVIESLYLIWGRKRRELAFPVYNQFVSRPKRMQHYLMETAFRRDFKDSEKDCKSDGPARSCPTGVVCPAELLLKKMAN